MIVAKLPHITYRVLNQSSKTYSDGHCRLLGRFVAARAINQYLHSPYVCPPANVGIIDKGGPAKSSIDCI